MSDEVIITVEDRIAYITLNRPKSGNAISLSVANALLKAAIYCEHHTEIRCVVLRGQGTFFCTGGDIEAFKTAAEHIPEFLSELAGVLNLAISRLLRMPKPLLVAMNGTAAGAGMSLALMGDIVLMKASAKLSPAYTGIGLSPDGGLTWMLPKLAGLRRAQEILLLNQNLSAQQALQDGLVTKVIADEDFEAELKRYAILLSQQALPAMSNIRQMLLAHQHNSLETHLELEARGIAAISLTYSAKEGVSAFFEKRVPDFQGHKA